MGVSDLHSARGGLEKTGLLIKESIEKGNDGRLAWWLHCARATGLRAR